MLSYAEPALKPPPKTKSPPVSWRTNPQWTDKMVAYLSEQPDFRRKLFSDSPGAAKKEGRRKVMAKDGKSQQYAVLADAIFAKDPVQSSAFKLNPTKFATAVETRLRRLKTDYQGFLEELGKTGAGLDPSQLRGDLENLQDSFREQWPWWGGFHAFWRELSSYNTVGVASSEHGTDHAAAAAADLYAPPVSEEDEGEPLKCDDTDDEGQDMRRRDAGADSDADAEGEGDDETFPYEQLPRTPPSNFLSLRSPSCGITPPPNPQSNRRKSKSNSVSVKSTPGSPRSSTAQLPRKVASGRDSGLAKLAAQKQTRNHKKNAMVDKFNENRDNETVRLSQKRAMGHAEEMGRLANKKLKLEIELLKLKDEGLATAVLLRQAPVTPRHHARRVPNRPNVELAFLGSGSEMVGILDTETLVNYQLMKV